MYNYLATLRTSQSIPSKSPPQKQQERKRIPSSPAPLANFSAQRATRLFLRQPADLDKTEQEELTLIRQASPSAETAYRLTQVFMGMIRERTGGGGLLDMWLKEAEESYLPEFASFASGIQQDKAAVLAGLTLPWNNGPTEGHVNRLKLIKRSMYGRAKFHLLKQRVLYCA
jgi:transposase